jgi:hypothetical protein
MLLDLSFNSSETQHLNTSLNSTTAPNHEHSIANFSLPPISSNLYILKCQLLRILLRLPSKYKTLPARLLPLRTPATNNADAV